MDRDEIERFVLERIAIHLKPVSEELSDVKVRLRSLYRNGDIGSPGFLDMRVEAEDKRYADLISNQEVIHRDVQTILFRQAKEDGLQAGRSFASEERRCADKGKQDRVIMWATIILALVGIFTVLTGIATLILAAKVNKGELELPKISHSESQQMAIESNQVAGPKHY